MLNKLFRPKWQHRNPKTRLLSIEKMTPDDTELLKTIVLSDSDADIRIAAFKKIIDISTLLNIFSESTFLNDKDSLSLHILKQIDAQHLNQCISASFLQDLKNCELLSFIITNSSNDKIINQSIAVLDDESEYLALLSLTKKHLLRQKLASCITSEAGLKKLLEWSKNKDKSIAKITKQRLEDINQKHRFEKNQSEKAEAVLSKLKEVNSSKTNTHFKGELIIAENAINEIKIDTLNKELIYAINEQMNVLRKAVNLAHQCEQDSAITQKTEQKKQEQRDRLVSDLQALLQRSYIAHANDIEQLTIDFNELKKNIDAIPTSDKNPSIINACHETENAIKQQAHLIKVLADCDQLLDGEKQTMTINELKKKQNKINHALSSAIAIIPSSNLIPKINDITKKISDLIKAKKIETQNHEKAIKQYIKDAENYVKDKQLNDARIAFQKAQRTAKQLSQSPSENFNTIFKRIETSINELADWRRFSTDPIRKELCQKMQALVDINIDPNQKAKSIKKLQEEWKNLGYSDDKALWLEFQSLSKEAFIPCQKAFDKEKEKRAFNAQQRIMICDEIESFLADLDWDTADFKSLDRLLQKVLNEWNRFSPVDRHDHQRLQDRFSVSINTLKEQITSHKRKNLDRLTDLCEKARLLSEEQDLLTAIEKYKILMEQWKTVGITFRKEQEEKWHNFREIGNQLHEKNSAIKKAQKEQKTLAVKNAEDLIHAILDHANSVKALNSLPSSEISQSFNRLVTEFNTIKDLPTHLNSKISKQFKAACQTYKKSININNQRYRLIQLSLFDQVWEKISKSTSDVFDNTWLPSEMNADWKERFSDSQKAQQNSIQHSPTVAQKLCIEMEMLCDVDSPPSDSQIRMDLHMASLKENFGSKQETCPFDKIEKLFTLWFNQPIDILLNNKHLSERFLLASKNFINDQLRVLSNS